MRFAVSVAVLIALNLGLWLAYHRWVWPGADRAHVIESREDSAVIERGQTLW